MACPSQVHHYARVHGWFQCSAIVLVSSSTVLGQCSLRVVERIGLFGRFSRTNGVRRGGRHVLALCLHFNARVALVIACIVSVLLCRGIACSMLRRLPSWGRGKGSGMGFHGRRGGGKGRGFHVNRNFRESWNEKVLRKHNEKMVNCDKVVCTTEFFFFTDNKPENNAARTRHCRRKNPLNRASQQSSWK